MRVRPNLHDVLQISVLVNPGVQLGVVRVTEKRTREADFSAKGMHVSRDSTPSDEGALGLAREDSGQFHHLGTYTLRMRFSAKF